MVSSNTERGYALFLLLAGLGFMSVGLNVLWAQHRQGHWKTWHLEAMQLNDERQRLLHYSADYASLYAPGGAGPGHLPCPDTDTNNTRPGPNPPCGRLSVAHGILPDGVSRTVGRVAFSASLENRSNYAVTNTIVNNPSFDISVGQWPDEHRFSSTQAGYAQLTGASGQSRVVTQTELAPLTFLWVRAWFVSQLLQSKFSECEKFPAYTDRSLVETVASQPTRNAVRVLALCQTLDFDISASALAVVDSTACSGDGSTCSIGGEQLIQWWVNASEWETVPLSRHWFVANGWYRSAEFSWNQRCLEVAAICELTMDPTHDGFRVELVISVDSSNSSSSSSNFSNTLRQNF